MRANPPGAKPERGQACLVRYTLRLEGSDEVLDRDKGEPFRVRAGRGSVIAGWDLALLALRVGEKACVTVPSSLGYGVKGLPGRVPPNATLVFTAARPRPQPTSV